MNLIILIGRVGKEPQCSMTKDGLEIAKFPLAVSRKNDREKADWFNCVCFGGMASKIVKPLVHKGQKIAITGEFRYEQYERDGETKHFTNVIVQEIELCANPSNVAENSANNYDTPPNEADNMIVNDDDSVIPF